ncbi:MAG: methylated-DNA--[protein]-cysteine S-methyltransferase [Firmicutes bacterium]|nr:methylated-DNA--[protein]-cysteine S-methyltransferase [Bacillota bacterium]MDY3091955.1 methylated-DNA--[protein]-cysteine S-methyltransferase [Erysipelotrichaceae bacterium]
MSRYSYNSPIGNLLIISDQKGIESLSISDVKAEERDSFIDETVKWLDLYFKGIEPDFKPMLSINVSEFKRRVYEIMMDIPFGKVKSYKEIAKEISPKMSAQAVGQACKKNPVILIIPCHRVIASDGIGGFAYGSCMKNKLLNHEGIELY